MHNTFCQPNARFLVYINGQWTKLTLKPGQCLERHNYCRTDEGYFAESYVWTHEGTQVREEQETASKDCDGTHGDSREDICPLSLLRSVPIFRIAWNGKENHWQEEPTGEFKPWWREVKGGPIFDEFAQLAGY